MTNFEISVVFFIELAVILAACRLVGRLVQPLGQSWAGILAPVALGALLAFAFHGRYGLFAADVKTGEVMLCQLARIIQCRARITRPGTHAALLRAPVHLQAERCSAENSHGE